MIFIIDDDEATRDSLTLLLECEGYAVRAFASRQGFLGTERPSHNDCVIVELDLPGEGGFGLLGTLRQDGNEVPAIIVAGRMDPAIRRRAEQLRALALVEKPYAAETLLSPLRQAVNAR